MVTQQTLLKSRKVLPAKQTNLSIFWNCKISRSLLRLGMCTPIYHCNSVIFGTIFLRDQWADRLTKNVQPGVVQNGSAQQAKVERLEAKDSGLNPARPAALGTLSGSAALQRGRGLLALQRRPPQAERRRCSRAGARVLLLNVQLQLQTWQLYEGILKLFKELWLRELSMSGEPALKTDIYPQKWFHIQNHTCKTLKKMFSSLF